MDIDKIRRPFTLEIKARWFALDENGNEHFPHIWVKIYDHVNQIAYAFRFTSSGDQCTKKTEGDLMKAVVGCMGKIEYNSSLDFQNSSKEVTILRLQLTQEQGYRYLNFINKERTFELESAPKYSLVQMQHCITWALWTLSATGLVKADERFKFYGVVEHDQIMTILGVLSRAPISSFNPNFYKNLEESLENVNRLRKTTALIANALWKANTDPDKLQTDQCFASIPETEPLGAGLSFRSFPCVINMQNGIETRTYHRIAERNLDRIIAIYNPIIKYFDGERMNIIKTLVEGVDRNIELNEQRNKIDQSNNIEEKKKTTIDDFGL